MTSETPDGDAGAAALRGQQRRAKARRLLRRSLIAAAIALYTLLFAEAYVRLFDPQAVMPRYITGTEFGVRGNIPNARYWHHTPEVDVQYRINGQGLRADHDYPLSKPAGVCRIAVFGDSFFFGLEADLENTFSARLEKKLRDLGVAAESMNFAVGGFGTAEMLQTYERFGRKFRPDIVIFSWDLSDLNDNVRADLYRIEDGRLTRAHDAYLPAIGVQDFLMRYRAYRFVADHSQLYTFVRERLNTFLKKRQVSAQKERLAAEQDAEEGEAPAGRDIDELQHANKLELSAAILRRAHDEVTADGSAFYVVDIPARRSRTEFASTIGILPSSSLERISVIEPLPAMSRAARPDLKLFYERGLGHLTPVAVGILVSETVKALTAPPRTGPCSLQARDTMAARDPASAARR